MSRVTEVNTILLFSFFLQNCAPSVEDKGTTFTDSAGVVLATAEVPAWDEGEGWRVSEEPILEIGVRDGPSDFVFSRVVGTVRLNDGRVVVADRDFANLRFYDATGEYLSSSGGEGEGPGEFRTLAEMGVLPGDSLITFDQALERIQLFDPAGTFLRSLQVRSSWPEFIPAEMIGVLDNRRIAMMYYGVDTKVPGGVSRWPPEMAVTFDIVTGASDSIVVVPGEEARVTPREGGGFGYYRLPFRKENDFAVGQGMLAVISNEAIAARVFSADGRLERILRHPLPPRPVTQQDIEDFVEDIVESYYPDGSNASAGEVASFREYLIEGPWGDTWPFLDQVQIDSEGNLWLQHYAHVGDPPGPYYVFSPTGVWLGEVALPPHCAACFQIGKDFILGVWTDEMDVQYVRMYRLEKG